MSTRVDKTPRGKSARPRSSATETREKIFDAARVLFSQAGFDQLGVREIAKAAGVDPAIVIRSFGSKEALFTAVASSAFALDEEFLGGAAGLGLRVARHLTGTKTPAPAGEFDEFAFLVRSAASTVAAPILSAALHASFVTPLAKELGGKDAAMRAALFTSCVLGFSTMRMALGSPAFERGVRVRLAERLGAALQACVDS